MLDIALKTSTTDTASPVFAGNQTLPFKVEKIEVVPADGEKPAKVKFVFKLAAPAKDKDGGDILPGGMGSTYTEFVPVTSKPDARDPEWNLKRLAAIQDAVLGTSLNHPTKPSRPDFDDACAQAMLGRDVFLKLKCETYEGRQRNSVAEWIFPGDLKA